MRCLAIAGTTADALEQVDAASGSTPPAPARCSGVSRTVIRPSGLSSRTTSPVSVIHDVVRSPANCHVDPERGNRRRRAAATSSRLPTSTSTGAFLSVAGSKMVHWWRGARHQAAVGQPARQVQRSAPAARPARASSVRVPPAVVIVERRGGGRRVGRAPRSGPVPGSSENSNDSQREARDRRARSCGWSRRSSRRAATSAAGRPPAARSRRRSARVWLTVKPIFSPR